MSDPQSSLVSELQHLFEEMKRSHAAFSATRSRAETILQQLSTENSSSGLESHLPTAKEDPFDLNPDFEKLLEEELSSAGSDDHYVERPFHDPYDCFEDSFPEVSFPFTSRHRRTGDLTGLFESDPSAAESPRPKLGPDVEIEYMPNGGYRMRSTPRNKQISSEDGLSS